MEHPSRRHVTVLWQFCHVIFLFFYFPPILFQNLILYHRFPRVSSDANELTSTPIGTAALLLREQVDRMDKARVQSSLNWIDRVPDKSKIQGMFQFDKVSIQCRTLIYFRSSNFLF
jgi:hypothetical protein